MTRKLAIGIFALVLLVLSVVVVATPSLANVPQQPAEGTPFFLPLIDNSETATPEPTATATATDETLPTAESTPTSEGAPTSEGTPTDDNVNTPTATATVDDTEPGDDDPSPTATRVRRQRTPTPTPTIPLPTPAPNETPNWFDTSMSGEQGMSEANYKKLVADAQSGAFDRPCTAEEHNPTKWHSLLNYEAQCHHDHQHGDNPFAVNDIFGPPGEGFKAAGWEVAYPWQTFPIADDEKDPYVQPAAGVLLENESKHEGYLWIVRRNQMCDANEYCLTDFRLQIHFHGTNDAATRWHSFSFEGRLCVTPGDLSTCATYRLGGWADFARLYVPPHESGFQPDCWFTFNGALEGKPDRVHYREYILQLPNHGQFYRPEDDTGPFDELRCHKQFSAETIAANPSGIESATEWWGRSPFDFRWQFRLWNPNGDVMQDATAGANYCAEDSPTCRWTHTRFTAEIDYVIPINSFLDSDGDNVADFTGWVNRLGWDGRNCGPQASLDCIWAEMDGIRENPSELGYFHDLTPNSRPWNYDITPAGIPSWSTWFRHYGH